MNSRFSCSSSALKIVSNVGTAPNLPIACPNARRDHAGDSVPEQLEPHRSSEKQPKNPDKHMITCRGSESMRCSVLSWSHRGPHFTTGHAGRSPVEFMDASGSDTTKRNKTKRQSQTKQNANIYLMPMTHTHLNDILCHASLAHTRHKHEPHGKKHKTTRHFSHSHTPTHTPPKDP